MRPRSLREVAEWTLLGESFDFALRSFLDGFYGHRTAQALAEEPPRMQGADPSGLLDAYFAATAEELSRESGFATPCWAWAEDRKLRRPWFALPWAGMRAVLLHESPPGFRSRNLFISANALARA